jgi:hypothetical protein
VQRLLDGAQHAGLLQIDVRSEVAEEGRLRKPRESLVVDDEVGDRRRGWPLAEQRADGLALVEAEPGQVHQCARIR